MAKAFPNTGVTIIDSSSDLPAASAALEGVMMFQKDSNELKICDGSNWVSVIDTDNKPMDVWTSYTPTVKQGPTNNITKTVNWANYLVIGKLIIVSVKLTITGTGTAANNMSVTPPSGFAPKYGGGIIGSVNIYDTSANTPYGGQVYEVAGEYMFVGDWSGLGAWGGVPSIAIANGDVINFTAMYEIN